MSARAVSVRLDACRTGLRELAALGLPASQTLPQALAMLHGFVASDTNHFTWADAQGRVSNYYGEGSADDAVVRTFFTETDALSAPGSHNFTHFIAHFDSIIWSTRDEGYARSPLYTQVMRHLGGEDMYCLVLRDPAGRAYGNVSMMRDRSCHPYSAAEDRLLRQLAPSLAELLHSGTSTAAEGDAAVQAQGMAVLDEGGRLLHCDPAGRRLLRMAGYPALNRQTFAGGLVDGVALEVHRLCRRAARLAHADVVEGPSRLEIPSPWSRLELRAHPLTPLSPGQPGLVGLTIAHHLPARLVIWRQVQEQDLTARQRQVCAAFAAGDSLSEIAQRLGLSRHTVIDHLDRVYDRLGVSPDRDALRRRLAATVLAG